MTKKRCKLFGKLKAIIHRSERLAEVGEKLKRKTLLCVYQRLKAARHDEALKHRKKMFETRTHRQRLNGFINTF